MPDRICRYRVARLSVFPPLLEPGDARYAIISNVVKNGVPTGQILADGTLRGCSPFPTTEEVLEMMDAAVRQHMLRY